MNAHAARVRARCIARPRSYTAQPCLQNESLELQYKTCYARILDSKRRFVEVCFGTGGMQGACRGRALGCLWAALHVHLCGCAGASRALRMDRTAPPPGPASPHPHSRHAACRRRRGTTSCRKWASARSGIPRWVGMWGRACASGCRAGGGGGCPANPAMACCTRPQRTAPMPLLSTRHPTKHTAPHRPHRCQKRTWSRRWCQPSRAPSWRRRGRSAPACWLRCTR